MKRNEIIKKAREQYFQSIARYFFKLRGTPFYLSPKELSIIDSWERDQIPLKVVLEGIKSAYEVFKQRPGKKNKYFSLSLCQRYIMKHFSVYRERNIGRKKGGTGGRAEIKKIKDEIKRFLSSIPPQTLFLQEVYDRVSKQLSQGSLDEYILEKEEAEVESLILKNASAEEKEIVIREVRKEFGPRDRTELSHLQQIKLIKYYRFKYKIPHISPFYY